jgi:hypothetical protein
MRFFHRSLLFTLVLAGLALIAKPAGASILGTYNDRATWEGLTTNRTDIDFTSLGIPQPGANPYNTAAGLTISGVTFVGREQSDSQFSLWASHAPPNAPEDWGSGTLLLGPQLYNGSYFQITFAVGITSFGIDLMSMDPGSAAFRILVDGVDTGVQIATSNRPNRTFFGLQTDSSFTQIRLVLDTGTLFQTRGLFDNISYGDVNAGSGGPGGGGDDPDPTPAETPEATTLLYAASGIGLMYWARRRRLITPAVL